MRKVTVLFAFCAGLLGLGAMPDALQAQVSLDMALLAPSNLQAFFLEDLNVSGRSPAAEVFRFTLTSAAPQPLNCYLVFSMSDPQTLIINGRSNDFVLASGITRSLSNLDLTQSGSPFELQDYEVSNRAQQIQDQLIATGYFPANTYRLKLELFGASSNTLLASDEVTALITNPFNIQLVSPLGTPSAPAALLSTTPVFAWSSQATQFLLKVCEQTTPDMDPQSVLQGRPQYETNAASPLSGQSFAYPTSGALPLEPGHVYYWQVKALVQTSSGIQEYPSDIGAFTIAQITAQHDPRLTLVLQRILGPGYQGVLTQLTGFQSNGRIMLDGVEVPIEKLEEIAPRFEQGAYRIRTVRVE